eukprot:scaffold111556_cov33-Tisochrysis_lutea.AAC.1
MHLLLPSTPSSKFEFRAAWLSCKIFDDILVKTVGDGGSKSSRPPEPTTPSLRRLAVANSAGSKTPAPRRVLRLCQEAACNDALSCCRLRGAAGLARPAMALVHLSRAFCSSCDQSTPPQSSSVPSSREVSTLGAALSRKTAAAGSSTDSLVPAPTPLVSCWRDMA